jgi:hypothetical protein
MSLHRLLSPREEYIFACRELNYCPWDYESAEELKQYTWEFVRDEVGQCADEPRPALH